MLANWVKQAVSAGGVGDLTLGGAPAGFVAFSAVFSLSQPFIYVIEDGDNREVGVGHLSATNTLVRDAVIETLSGGTLTRNNPTPLNVSTSASVSIASVAQSIMAIPQAVGEGVGASAARRAVRNAAFGAHRSTMALTVDRTYVQPFLLTVGGVYDAFLVEENSNQGEDWHIALYAPSAASGLPGKLLRTHSSAATGNGFRAKVFAEGEIRLQPGWYFIALNSGTDDGPTATGRPSNMIMSPFGVSGTNSYPCPYIYKAETHSTHTFQDPFDVTGWTYQTGGTEVAPDWALRWVRP